MSTTWPDTRTPKQLLYGQLPDAKHHAGGQRKRNKDQLHVNFKSCNLDHTMWQTLAEDRCAWKEECNDAVNRFEEPQCIDAAKVHHAGRKDHCHSACLTFIIHTPATHVDGPVHLAARSVTNETIAEIRRVNDSFHPWH